jgi:hypothetical protein
MQEDHGELMMQFWHKEKLLQQREKQLSEAQGEPACRQVLQRAWRTPNHLRTWC